MIVPLQEVLLRSLVSEDEVNVSKVKVKVTVCIFILSIEALVT